MAGSNGVLERKALIFNVQKYNVFDGPGVRTLVFFKGCPLRCKWCANPEGIHRKIQVMMKHNVCINCGKCVEVCPQHIHKMDKDLKHYVDRNIECIGCRKCTEVCPARALEIMGEEKTISELLDVVLEDKMFYESSGGGVTIGGGECTAQPEACASLLNACKLAGVNTAIETCGYAKLEDLLKIAEFVDLFLFDIKQFNSDLHQQWTGVRNERILDNLKELLHRHYNVCVRMPLLKGVNSSREDIEGVIELLTPYKEDKNFKGINLLPYHKMGVGKYDQLDIEYPIEGDPSLSEEELDEIESWLSDKDFPVKVIRH
ncbi:MAG: choline TMA-lyase-activating enzyme [Clostridia bacterium]|nr:choline TMA-lyase-activating enzyme [Clostridia bacterium]